MRRIQMLPPGLVNQIAAGEVVERPASVVKELVENALDAGARQIQIDVEEGGLALVRVADDGCGMDGEDARLSLERHATSKLVDAAGLSRIATMGFRGEALPAIASVARLRLDTCDAAEGSAGTRIAVEGGRMVERGPVARARGTTVEVRDLFFNTPARRKFMRAPSTESGHVSEAVLRLGLAHTECGFLLRSGGRAALTWPGGTPLPARAAAALGREAASALVPVEGARGDVRVFGLAGPPEHAQPTGRGLYLFVNGRFVRDRGAAHAALRAYSGVLPAGRFPVGILFVELPLERVDVNVHPQKLEVRFADARSVHDAVFHAVAGALRSAPWLAHAQRRPEAASSAPLDALAVPMASEEIASVLSEARAGASAGFQPNAPPWGGGEPAPGCLDSACGLSPSSDPEERGQAVLQSSRRPAYFGSLRYVGQHARTYLLCEAPGGSLVIVDQHASHERILFHRLQEAWTTRRLVVQPFLVPQVVTLPAPLARALEAGAGELRQLGLEIEPFGGDAFAITGAPAALAGVELAALLPALAQQVEQLGRGSALDDAVHDLLATMACHSAIRANQDISAQEAQALLDGLDGVDFKARCPHGRPVVFELPIAEIERKVGRR